MLYVRIELWPGGDRSRARVLQEATVINSGTGNEEHGDYSVKLSHSSTYKPEYTGWVEPHAPPRAQVWKHGTIAGFRRNRSPAELVLCALLACGIRGPR